MDAMVEADIIPARKIPGVATGVLRSTGEGFQTAKVDSIAVTFEGLEGDGHAGLFRQAGGREPWYRRGTIMRNERQISIVSPDELSEVAAGMEIDRIEPEWIGANMVADAIDRLSMIPPGTRFHFEKGVVLVIQGQNAPCRFAGAAIAEHYPGRDGLDLLFPKVAKRLRGLVAWVERPGRLTAGEPFKAWLSEQWIYP